MTYKDYKHYTKIQIRFKDIDKLGHVNNANHLTYFETARVEYFNDVFKQKINWKTTSMILARAEVDYKMPVFLEDNLYCFTKIETIGNKSFIILNSLVKKHDNDFQLCAEGKFTIVCMNYELRQTTQVPKEWKQAIEIFEKQTIGS